MAVYDRWFTSKREADGATKRVRSADHGCEKRWQVRWRDHTGVQRKQSYARRIDAEQFDAKIKTQLADGTYIDPAAGKLTFKVYAEEWRAARTHDLATAERIETALRRHVYSADGTPGRTATGGPSIGDYQLRELGRRPSILQQWIAGLVLGENSKRKIVSDVGQVFIAAVEDGLIPANPLKAKSVQKPKAVKTEAIPWTGHQVAAVAAALPSYLGVLPLLAAATGLRQGEVFGLALSDLDMLRRTLRVEVQVKIAGNRHLFGLPKNRKTRDVPIPGPLLPILAEHIRQHPPAEVTLPWARPDGKPTTRTLLFPNSAGQVLDRHGFNHQWRRAWRAAGIPDRGRKNGFHVTRHTAASTWLSNGLSLAKTAAYLGDTQQVVLDTYSHFIPGDDDRARGVMDAWVAAAIDAEPSPSALNVPDVAR